MKRSSIVPILGVTALLLACSCSSNDDVQDDPGADGGDTTGADSGNGKPGTGADGGPSDDDGPKRCAEPPCEIGEPCIDPSDCTTDKCKQGQCIPSTGDDGVKNGDETDVDCGGSAVPCPPGKACAGDTDCANVKCTGNVCQEPSKNDGIKNGTETDVDCGGGAPTNAPKCAAGAKCKTTDDCDNVACADGTCQAASGNDGIKNGTETDVDCGGGAPTNAPKCGLDKACKVKADCDNADCNGGVCKATSSDGIKNGTETDVDCGGGAPTNAPKCGIDKGCSTHADCSSSACAISGPKAGKCIAAKSCVNYAGGYTCGKGTDNGLNATDEYESCCDTAPLSGTTRIDRFTITAGRMRAFIERLNGDVRGWVTANKPAGWGTTSPVKPTNPSTTSTKTYKWLDVVPGSVDEANMMLGPYWLDAPNDPQDTNQERDVSKRSCGSGGYTGHTYWVPEPHDTAAAQVYSKDVLDTKALNCVNWHLLKAFCAWEGGHLATASELTTAYRNGSDGTTRPWGYAGSLYNQAYGPPNVPYAGGVDYAQDERLNHNYNYGYPGNQPANNVVTWWISPPGRFWKGWNKNKVEIDGNLLEWTGNGEYNFVWRQSFEHHQGTTNNDEWRYQSANPNDWPRAEVPNGYYAIGGRCVYP